MSKLTHVEETYARLAAGDKDAIMEALMIIMEGRHGTYLRDAKRVQERAEEIRKDMYETFRMTIPRQTMPEKIQVDKVDIKDALSCLSVIDHELSPVPKNSILEFRLFRLRVCLEHMLNTTEDTENA